MKKIILFAIVVLFTALNTAPVKAFSYGVQSENGFKLSALTAKQCREKGGVPVSGVFGPDTNCIGSGSQNPIFAMISIFLQFAIAMFALSLVAILVFAGIRYIASGGNPDDVPEAKNLIKAVLTALVLFAIMFAVLRLIIPEGVGVFRT